MNFKISWGDRHESFTLPKDLQLIQPQKSLSIIPHINPNLTQAIADFLKPIRGNLNIIVNDGTRPTPTAHILEQIENTLRTWEQNSNKICFTVATGTHRKANILEISRILGPFSKHPRIDSHDCKDEKNLTYLGKTKAGTELSMNKKILKSDAIIVIGSIEPHYFAGFSGGRKAFLPGISAYETIEQNHKLALLKGANSMQLQGNPIHEDMDDALNLLPEIPMVSIQAVGKDTIFVGGIRETFELACENAKEQFSLRIPEKADIVIAQATFPMDSNLYQTHKAMENASLAVKEDGTMIVVSQCEEGIGPENFFELLTSDTPENIISKAFKNYKLGYHKPVRLLSIMNKCKIIFVSDIEKNIIEQLGFIDKNSVESALKVASGKTLLYLPNASTVNPVIDQ